MPGCGPAPGGFARYPNNSLPGPGNFTSLSWSESFVPVPEGAGELVVPVAAVEVAGGSGELAASAASSSSSPPHPNIASADIPAGTLPMISTARRRSCRRVMCPWLYSSANSWIR